MLDNLEALAALADTGTMGKAALALHVTQSAISKRIANLEHQLKQKLVVPHGRRVELTPVAIALLQKSRPLMAALKDAFIQERAEASGKLVIDVANSVLISWGASALAKVKKKLAKLELEVSARHASVAVERVRAGESMIAIVQGASLIAPELSAHHLFNQTMVIVPSELKPFRISNGMKIPLLAIESYTESWHFIEEGIKSASSEWGFSFEVIAQLQSFSAITQMARSGFGHGLVPRGVARTLGIPQSKLVKLPKPGLTNPVSLVGRRSTIARSLVQKFYQELIKIEETADE